MKFKHVSFNIIQIFCFKFTFIALIFTSFVVFEIYVLVQIVLCLGAEKKKTLSHKSRNLN